LGGAESVLLLDESALAKKGRASAGVARQWNGRLGKVDNCQVGVFATLCRGGDGQPIDARLYLPKAWAEDEARCRKAAIPEQSRRYRSKADLALEMVETALKRGIRFGYVGVDGGYGKEPAFLSGLDGLGCRFVADVHCDQTVYLQNPDRRYRSGRDAVNVRFTSRPNLTRCGLTDGRPPNRPRRGNG
jgi:SRSO17 transposase